MKRVLVIAYHFPPSGGGPVLRVTKLVKYLGAFGWQPTVLAATPPAEGVQDASLLEEIPSEVRVLHVPAPSLSNRLRKARAGRGLLRLLWGADVWGPWRRRALRAATSLVEGGSYDALLTTDPVTCHLVGLRLHRRTGIPWVVDIRDLWTQSFTYRPLSWMHGKWDERLESAILHGAGAIVCVTRGYVERLASLYPRVSGRLCFVPNGFDEADFQSCPPPAGDTFTLLHAGQLYDFTLAARPKGWRRLLEPLVTGPGEPLAVRSVESLARGLSEFLAAHPAARNHLRLEFLGAIPPSQARLLDACGLADVVSFSGHVSHREAVGRMCSSQVLLLIQDGAGSEIVVPGKLYEYLRSGRPILALMREGEATALLRQAKGGHVATPTDAGAVAKSLEDLHAAWIAGTATTRTSSGFLEAYERKTLASRMAGVLETAASMRREGGGDGRPEQPSTSGSAGGQARQAVP
jgi:glycosyltransferase involved in cell wall biosynthesis